MHHPVSIDNVGCLRLDPCDSCYLFHLLHPSRDFLYNKFPHKGPVSQGSPKVSLSTSSDHHALIHSTSKVAYVKNRSVGMHEQVAL